MPKVKYTTSKGLVQSSGEGFEVVMAGGQSQAVISGSFKATKNVTLGRQAGDNAVGADQGNVTLCNPSGSKLLGGAQPQMQTLVWMWDHASGQSGVSEHTLTDPQGNALSVPPNFVALRGWVEVITAVTSGGSLTVLVGTAGTSNDPNGLLLSKTKAVLTANSIFSMDGALVSGSGVTGESGNFKRFITTDDPVTLSIGTAESTAGKLYVYLQGYNSAG